MSKFIVDIHEFITLIKVAGATASKDKKDPYHSGVLLMKNDNQLLGVGFTPDVSVGAYSVPLSGTFDSPVILPAHTLGVITAFLNNIGSEDIEEITVGATGSGFLHFQAPGARLEIAGLEQGEYLLPDALDTLRGVTAKNKVVDPDTEEPLDSGARFNLGKKGYKVLSSLANVLGDVSLIPTAHKASWVMMDSPSTPNWNGAIMGNVYPIEYPVDSVAVPLFDN